MKTKLVIIIVALVVLLAIIAVVFIVRNITDNKIDTNIDLSDVPPALNPETKEFIIKAGVNTPGLEGAGYFFERGLKYLTQKSTYTDIKEQGFDHIRVPVDFRLFYNEETNTLDEELIKNYDKILDLAEWAGLYVMVDFHGWYDITPSSKTDTELFINIWKLVAERYKDRSNYVIFELMNEPSIQTAVPVYLNRLQKQTIEAIRESNPERLILCAAPDGNQPWMLGKLSIPEDDKNLAVAVHIYHPADFTHQGFEWAGHEQGKQVRLTEAHLEELNWNLDETKKFIDETGIPVIINEFGMNLEISEKEDRYTYLGTIAEFCDENNIPWTLWRYNGREMGIYDNGKWKEDLLDVLFLRK